MAKTIRLLTPQLEETLRDFPLYSQDSKGDKALCLAIFALGSTRWFIIEGERQGDDYVLYGIVTGLHYDEYGYMSLKELSELAIDVGEFGKLQVRMQPNFTPVELGRLKDHRLQSFLRKFALN